MNDESLKKLADNSQNLKVIQLRSIDVEKVSDDLLYDLWKNQNILVYGDQENISP